MSSVSSARAANKLRSQNEVIDKERQERANRVNGVSKGKAIQSVVNIPPMGKIPNRSTVKNGVGTGGPVIPLKTRVVQLLALGPATVADIVGKVGGLEQDVMRVVNVVHIENGVLPYRALMSLRLVDNNKQAAGRSSRLSTPRSRSASGITPTPKSFGWSDLLARLLMS